MALFYFVILTYKLEKFSIKVSLEGFFYIWFYRATTTTVRTCKMSPKAMCL